MTLLDRVAVCRLIGGTRPIHASTLWRMVKAGKLPKPIAVSAQIRRWSLAEVEAALTAMREGR